MNWEDTFKSWGSAPSVTEQQKMINAETAIRKAILANPTLANMEISIFAQGSYKSKTNVRNDSDVDICVCLHSTFFPRYPSGKTREYYGNSPGSISFSDYKDLIHKALGNYFGYDNITKGNKAFDIHSNSYRVDADVVPAMEYRFYYDNDNGYHKPTGIAFDPDKGERIINWPQQVYDNCLDKHNNTGQRYRKMTRILKRLRNKMASEGMTVANDIPSFLIQSMVWSASDACFNRTSYTADVRAVLAHCFNETLSSGNYASLKEVNDIKYIFGSHQPCTREKAHTFFSSAWDYIGFD